MDILTTVPKTQLPTSPAYWPLPPKHKYPPHRHTDCCPQNTTTHLTEILTIAPETHLPTSQTYWLLPLKHNYPPHGHTDCCPQSTAGDVGWYVQCTAQTGDPACCTASQMPAKLLKTEVRCHLVSSMHTAGLYWQYYPFQYRTTTSKNGCSSMNSDPPTSFLHFVATHHTVPPFPFKSYTYPNFCLPWFFFLFFDLGGGGGSESILLHMIEPYPSLANLRLSNHSSSGFVSCRGWHKWGQLICLLVNLQWMWPCTPPPPHPSLYAEVTPSLFLGFFLSWMAAVRVSMTCCCLRARMPMPLMSPARP